jgi:pyruvate,water dikinase
MFHGSSLRENSVPSLVEPLAQATAHDEVGGKAHALAQLLALGMPVPDGFVLTRTAFERFLDQGGRRRRIDAALASVRSDDLAALHRAAEEVHAIVHEGPLPAEVSESLATARHQQLGSARIAVRSSAVGEDSGDASFAGQLSSILDVASGDDALEGAVRECWASYWSERVLAYQMARDRRLRGMGVVVQRLVPASFAGVVFTRAPVAGTAGRDEMVGEYCLGLGESLVSGALNPGRFVVDRGSFAGRWLCAPDQQEGATAEQEDAARRFVEGGGASQLARLGMELERALGAPQDIEWAVDPDQRLFVLQSRPITTATAAAPPRRTVVWSNANVNENFPGPVTPLLFSIARTGYTQYFRNLGLAFGVSRDRLERVEHALRHVIGVHGARIYYNLSNIHTLLHLLPFGGRLTDYFNAFVGTSERAAEEAPESWAALARRRVHAAWEISRLALHVAARYARVGAGVARFERTVDEYCDACDRRLASRPSLHEALELLHGFLQIRFHRWTDAALADAASMVGYGVVKTLLARGFPQSDRVALENDLLKGLSDLVSSAPAVGLWHLSRMVKADPALQQVVAGTPSASLEAELERDERFAPFRAALNRFLSEWGFRCPGELMLTVPSFEEEPAGLFDLLKAYLEVDGDSPEAVIARQEQERAAATERVLAVLSRRRLVRGLPFLTQARALRAALAWTRRAVALRERARLKQSRLYSRCRRVALAIGDRLVEAGRLDHREDVFYFSYEELDGIVAGGSMLPARLQDEVAWRKRRHAGLSALAPPDTLVLTEGAAFGENSADVAITAGDGSGPDADGVLRGVSACGGRAEARAAVLSDLSEARRLRPGDVLVTRQTDPAWGPVFFLIKGLVLERGGMLSHGAVVAREFGIPSVVGVRDATRRIADGQRVVVDGDRGHVTILG